MPKSKIQCQPPKNKGLQGFITDKHLVVFLGLVIVVAINYLVFSYLLLNREKANALTTSEASSVFTDMPNMIVPLGTPNVLLGEIDLPDGLTRFNLGAGWVLDQPAETGAIVDNKMISMVDADGPGSLGAGTDDEKVKYINDLAPYWGNIGYTSDIYFQTSDCTFTDNWSHPTEVYVDGNCDGTPANGGQDFIILDKDGSAVMDKITPPYFDVALSPGRVWLHSELVNENMAYDYDAGASGNLYYTDSGACGGPIIPPLPTDFSKANKISFWGDLKNNGIFDPGEDVIYWDPSGCLSTGPCSHGGCTGLNQLPIGAAPGPYVWVNIPAGWMIFGWDGDGTKIVPPGTRCAGRAGDGKFVLGDPMWIEDVSNPSNIPGVFDPADLPLAPCLSGGEVGVSAIPGNKVSETIWLADPNFSNATSVQDMVAYQGTAWGDIFNPLPNQFQSDTAGQWNANEMFWDVNADGILDSGSEPIFRDNGNGQYNAADSDYDIYLTGIIPGDGTTLTALSSAYGNVSALTAFDCDGTATTGVGGCDAIIINQVLKAVPNNLCVDDLIVPTVGYIDGNSDCIFGNGGVDQVIVDFGGSSTVMAKIKAASHWSYYDFNGNNTYNLGEDIYYRHDGVYPTIYTNYHLIYADADANGHLDYDPTASVIGKETILVDNGFIENGLSGDNGVIDLYLMAAGGFLPANDMMQALTLTNDGTAIAGTDYNNISVWIDVPAAFTSTPTDGRCTGGGDDTLLLSGLPLIGKSWTLDLPSFLGLAIPLFPYRICFTADILPTATNGASIRFSIPKLKDSGTLGQYDPGDEGYFVYSENDGPTDKTLTSPYVVFLGQKSTMTTPSASIAPADPTDCRLVAQASGQVTLYWTDPQAGNLTDIVIQRDHNPYPDQIIDNSSYDVAKVGVGQLTDSKVIKGESYWYKIKARNADGLLSNGCELKVTIPDSGQIEVPNPAEKLPAGISVGDLVKDADSSTVYVITPEYKRNIFPNFDVFSSYFADFSRIKNVSSNVIAQIPIGRNMTLRAGTWLMKLQTSPDVFAIEPGGKTLKIDSEQVAQALYGNDWQYRVIDMVDIFFRDYQEVGTLNAGIYPTGSLLQYKNTADIYYMENGKKRVVSNATFVANSFQNKFVVKNVDAIKFSYPDGDPLAIFGDYLMALPLSSKVKASTEAVVPNPLLDKFLAAVKKANDGENKTTKPAAETTIDNPFLPELQPLLDQGKSFVSELQDLLKGQK